MVRRLFALLNSLWLLSLLTLGVSAREVPDVSRRDCSIEVRAAYDGTPISGGTLTAIRVGEIAEADGNFSFRRVPDGTALENIQSPDTAEELVQYASESTYAFETQTVTVKNGCAEFRNLSTGLYLILQKSPAAGYIPLNAFLVSLPYQQDGHYLYHVTATAKTELERGPEPTAPPPPPDNDTLPQTGQRNWPIPVLAGAGIALILLGQRAKKRPIPIDKKKQG